LRHMRLMTSSMFSFVIAGSRTVRSAAVTIDSGR
jgi:hypothetical protein